MLPPSMSTTQQDQVTRDIAAALADLRGRRDQAVADLDERIAQLNQLSTSLEDGALDSRVVQERVRRLIGEKAPNPASRVMSAGRTQIGMRMSGEHTPVGPRPATGMSVRLGGPSATMATASLNRAAATTDSRIVALLSGGLSSRDETRLELALLRRVRRSLDEHSASVPEDVVLIGTLIEYADDVLALVGDLDAGGAGRVRRLLDYDRELVSQLAALGTPSAPAKEQIQKARALLGETPTAAQLQQATSEAVTIFTRTLQDIAKKSPAPATSMLDELVRG